VLRDFTTQVFSAAGLPREDATLVADVLVEASLRGVDSHGLMRIPLYTRRLEARFLNPRPAIEVVREFGGTPVLDAADSMGQVAMSRALELALDLAGAHGIGCVGVRNSSHFGPAGHYARRALERGVIALIFTNGPPVMAPFGGREARLCNNPI